MNNIYIRNAARDDFNKARFRETLSRILNLLSTERQELMSLQDVREMVRPKRENYRGMQVVRIDHIVGSEGRYGDFNQSFLPKHEYIRDRWESVDRAHLQDINLPPIKLYKIGDVYFVRDGNHRVSVARMKGGVNIDAEVIELDSEIPIEPSMTQNDLKNKVIEYERDRVFRKTDLGKIIKKEKLSFSETGRYLEILKHINVHKYYLNQNKKEEISFVEAGKSWYKTLYQPIIEAIENNNLLFRFPGRTRSDLYVWIIQHWDELKREEGGNVPIEEAAVDYARKFGRGLLRQFRDLIKRIIHRLFRR
ncbi:MAG: transcriptional regulator [Spirochaetales bacterium]|nr:transcriptional regulator [Spirochaetales bacterium]